MVGLAGNPRLEQRAGRLLGEAYGLSTYRGRTEHVYGETLYAAQSWSHRRRVIIKAEVVRLPRRDPRCNPRLVVTVSADAISHHITELKSPLKTDDNVPSPLITTEEGRMLRKEDFMVIHALAQRGLYLGDIAKQLGVHPRTVRRALTRGGAPAPRPRRRGSRLDPYRADIDRLLAEDVWNAVVIFRELQGKGYTGRLSILRDYIRPKRLMRVRRCALRRPPADNCRAIGPSPARESPAWSRRSTSSSTRWASHGASTSGARIAKTPNIPMRD